MAKSDWKREKKILLYCQKDAACDGRNHELPHVLEDAGSAFSGNPTRALKTTEGGGFFFHKTHTRGERLVCLENNDTGTLPPLERALALGALERGRERERERERKRSP